MAKSNRTMRIYDAITPRIQPILHTHHKLAATLSYFLLAHRTCCYGNGCLFSDSSCHRHPAMHLRNSLSLLSHGLNAMCATVVYSAELWFISYAQYVFQPVVHITEILKRPEWLGRVSMDHLLHTSQSSYHSYIPCIIMHTVLT